ncbi:MAG: PAS domain S-box protein, partial [Spirochaetaceae bacterium]|nr:PAS domain S-box protein [Spirochaetaceae bacterium]
TKRCSLSGADEPASLALDFNLLLDALDAGNDALVTSETRYRMLLRNIRAAVVVHGPDTRILMSNPMAQELLGLTEDQMLGKAVLDPSWRFLREDGSEMPFEEYPVSKTIATRAAITDEVIGLRRTDSDAVSWVLANTAIAASEDGALGDIIVTFVDITERKLAEEERRTHLKLLESLDSVDRATHGTNDLGQMMNGLFEAIIPIFGCDCAWLLFPSKTEAASWRFLIGRGRRGPWTPAQGVDIPSTSGLDAIFQASRASAGPVGFGSGTENPMPAGMAEFATADSLMAMVVHPKGQVPHLFGLHWSSSPREGKSADDRLFLEIGRRLTDALTGLLTLRDLHDSETRYREVFENVSDAIAVSEIAEDGRMKRLDCNPAWEKAYGVDRTAVIGKHTVDATQERYRSCLAEGIPHSFEDETRNEAETRCLRSTFIPVKDASGRIYRIIEAGRDITEQRRSERELSQLKEELERRVLGRIEETERRSVELRESQIALVNIVEDLNEKTSELERANAKLRELDRLKSMFIASMSHELRTPLNSIIGFSSILLNEWIGPLSAEQKENLAAVLRAGKHLLSLINDVIDVSKIEAGKIESIAEEFEVRSVVAEAMESIRADTIKKGLELRVSAHPLTLNAD